MAQLQSTSITGSLQVSTNITASNISASLLASFINGTVLSSSYAATASVALNASTPTTVPSASWVSSSAFITTAQTASFVTASGVSGYVANASHATTADTASFASTFTASNGITVGPSSGLLIVTSSNSLPFQMIGNINNEFEIINTNNNAGNTASADFVAFNDLGSAASYQGIYGVDLGINSSGYSYGFIGKGNDSYLFATGSQSSSLWIGMLDPTGSIYLWAGSSTTSGSGLLIQSQSITTPLGITSSAGFKGTADTASFITASGISGYVANASHATTADTASSVTSPLTASIIFAPTNIESPSYQLTQSYTSIYGAAYTIVNSDNGKLIMFTSSVVQNVTLTTSSVDGGWSGMFYQSGSSKIAFITASTSVVLRTRSGLTGSAGQYAIVNVLRVPNGDFILSGDVG